MALMVDEVLQRIAEGVGIETRRNGTSNGHAHARSNEATVRNPGAAVTEKGAAPDLDNAARLIERHGGDIRFCTGRGWLVWNGRQWAEDAGGQIFELAKDTLDAALQDALDRDDGTLAKALINARSGNRITAMVRLAETDPRVRIDVALLDADPFVLNCPNGTLDLRTGELRPHNRRDLLTACTAAEYHPDAEFERWDQFIEQATGSDAVYADFLQRATGYSSTGDVSEEIFFLIYGGTGTGKTTFLESVKAALGRDYTITTDFESLLEDRRGIREDVAALAGKRLSISVETSANRKLAEGLVKLLTGGDAVRARYLYKNSFEFQPTWHLWLCSNDAPRVRQDDDAHWRRARRLPFEHRPANPDPTLKRQLKDAVVAGPAVLRWIVEGARKWHESGLGQMPEVVRQSTDAWRAESDVMSAFFDDVLLFDDSVTVERPAVWDAFKRWADKGHGVTRNKLYARLESDGCQVVTIAGKRHFRGVAIAGAQGAVLGQGAILDPVSTTSLTRARVTEVPETTAKTAPQSQNGAEKLHPTGSGVKNEVWI